MVDQMDGEKEGRENWEGEGGTVWSGAKSSMELGA
jgi:hypothetical protein